MRPIKRTRDNIPAQTKDDVRGLALAWGQRQGTFNVLQSYPFQLPAIINGGRWMVRCTLETCTAGIYADPDLDEVVCFGCGSIYAPVFPDADTVAEIEAALEVRSVANQNWGPPETIEDLQRENSEHGL